MDALEPQSNPRRAVVTGSSGFIGRHLVGALLSRGYSVTGIDRRPGTPEGARAITADVAGSSASVVASLEEADAVWHLAACPGVRVRGPGIARQRNRDNIEAGRVVFDRTPSDTPVVVTSSSSVYGGSLHGGALRPSRETMSCGRSAATHRPRWPWSDCSLRRSRGGWTAVARRIDDIARIVCKEVGITCRPEVVPASSEEVVATLADVYRARDLLGIEPNTDVIAVIVRQIDAARSVPLPAQREVV